MSYSTDFTKHNLLPVEIELKPGQRLLEVQKGVWIPVGIGGNFEPLSPGEKPSSGGAFDLVKVTEYSPYVPAYPPQKGYNITFTMKDYGGGDYDSSAYHGVYTVTEETKGCTSFGRVYKNANGKFLYAWNEMQYEQGTDDSDPQYLCWCVSDNLGGGMYSALANTDGSDLSTATWNSMNYQLETATCTEVQTSEATEEIPMVLKGVVCTFYNLDRKEWVFEDDEWVFRGFEKEPKTEAIYAMTSGKLIGNVIGYDIDFDSGNGIVLYYPMNQKLDSLPTGQVLTYSGTVSEAEIEGRKCLHFTGNSKIQVPMDNIPSTSRALFTFSCWAYCTVNSKSYMLFYGSNPCRALAFAEATGCLEVVRNGNDYNTDSIVSKNKWQHIVWVYDGVNDIFYINGELKYTRPFEVADTTISGNFYISSFAGQQQFFEGYMAQYRVFNRALSLDEIQTLYQKELSTDRQGVGNDVPNLT